MSAMKKDELSEALDAMFLRLISAAEPDKTDGQDQPDDGPPPIGFLDRLRLFSEGVRWAAVKSRYEDADATDQFGELKRGLVGRTGKRHSVGAASPPRPAGTA